MKKVLAAVAIGAASIVAMGSSALAGEVTGNGKPTQGPAHARSSCAFSGLDDQDPADGGSGVVTPGEVQNWGHTKGAPIVVSSKGAGHVTLDFGGGPFETGCNAHDFPEK